METEKYEGIEKREVPRTGELTDEMVVGATVRIVKNPGTVDEAQFTEGDMMREEVRKLLLSKTPRSQTILTRATTLDVMDRRDLEQKFFAPTIDGLRKAFTNRGILLPTDDEILAILLEKFTPEKVEALRKAIKVPGLLAISSDQSFENMEMLLNANKKRKNQLDVVIFGNRRSVFEKQDLEASKNGQQGLKFGFGEMSQELPNLEGRMIDIITKWKNSPLAEISRTANQDEYAMLQVQAKDLLDVSGQTILSRKDKPSEIPADDGLVSTGFSDFYNDGTSKMARRNTIRQNMVRFSGRYLCEIYNDARIRPVVIGE